MASISKAAACGFLTLRLLNTVSFLRLRVRMARAKVSRIAETRKVWKLPWHQAMYSFHIRGPSACPVPYSIFSICVSHMVWTCLSNRGRADLLRVVELLGCAEAEEQQVL